MGNTATNVSTGKPNVGGAIYCAKITSTLTLPTDATTKMSTLTDFKCLGYCGDDGFKNSISKTFEKIKAWGGDTVLTTQTEFEDTFGFKLIEILNVDTLKSVFGEDNVTGDLSSGITIKVNSKETEPMAWVVDMVMSNGSAKRVVVPSAKITELGEIQYNDSDAIGYDSTLTATPDSAGNTHYEYIK